MNVADKLPLEDKIQESIGFTLVTIPKRKVDITITTLFDALVAKYPNLGIYLQKAEQLMPYIEKMIESNDVSCRDGRYSLTEEGEIMYTNVGGSGPD